MANNSNQGLIAQAKEFVAGQLEAAKEAVGLNDNPQGKVQHDQPFLNDIAKGDVPSLSHVQPVEKDLTAVLGQDASQIHIKKVDREPLLSEIKDGAPLAHVETQDKSKPVIEEGVQIKNIGEQRDQLLHDVEGFKRNELSATNTNDRSTPVIPEQVSGIVPAPSLLDQAKDFVAGTIESVKHAIAPPPEAVQQTKEFVSGKVEEVKQQASQAKDFVNDKLEETKKTVASADPKATLEQTKEFVADKIQEAKEAVGITPAHPQAKVQHDQPFLNDIAKGNVPSMAHVDPVEKTLNLEQCSDIHIKKFDKEPLLNEIKDGVPLAHVETQDKSVPVIEEGVQIKNVGEQREQLLNEVVQAAQSNTLNHVEPPKMAGTQ